MGTLNNTTEEIQNAIDQQYDGNQAVNVGYDDFYFSVNNLRINPATLKPDFDQVEGEYLFDDSTTETVIGNRISLHKYKIYTGDEDVIWYPHVHWAQESVGVVVWQLEYKMWKAGSIEPSWTTITAVDPSSTEFAYTSGSLQQISELPEINMNVYNSPAVHVKIRVSRLGGNIADTYSGDVRFLGFDFHVPIDQERGSRQIFNK